MKNTGHIVEIELISPDIAEALCRQITIDLPEYFGLPAINEHYALGVKSKINFAAKLREKFVALLSMDFPYPSNGNIYWMGILRDYHRTGIGMALVDEAVRYAKEKGARTMTVETLAESESDENYLKTYRFYQACGFSPMFNLKPQGYEWNMVYMIKIL